MNYRDSKYYTQLSILDASLVAEKAREPESEEEFYSAWQILIDRNYVWNFHGWFGRQAVRFIQDEVLQPGDENEYWKRQNVKITRSRI